MTYEARRMAERHLMLTKLFKRDSPIYRTAPNVRARNERELLETTEYFRQRPGLFELCTKPKYIRRRKDVKAWQFQLKRNGEAYTKQFKDIDYGSAEKAEEAAQAFATRVIKKLERKC